MEKNNPKAREKALNYAFLLLKFRPRSKHEISTRLNKKKFDPLIIDNVLKFLEEKNFINDEDFTKAWISYRIKSDFGLRRIKLELKQKGIAKDLVEQLAVEQFKGYSEKSIIEALAKKRLKRMKGLELKKKRQRLYGFLLRRGFSQTKVIEVINDL